MLVFLMFFFVVVVVIVSCTLHLVCAKETVQEHMYTKKLGLSLIIRQSWRNITASFELE